MTQALKPDASHPSMRRHRLGTSAKLGSGSPTGKGLDWPSRRRIRPPRMNEPLTALSRPPRTAPPGEAPAWHAQSAAAVLRGLDAGAGGLSAAQAAERLARHGPNRLPAAARRSALRRFLAQFHNVLIYVLLCAAVVTALLGHALDASVIVAVVFVNAVVGHLQEGKAEAALDAIRAMLSPRAVALRDGARCELPAEALVPGDVVMLAAGDRVSADLRLLDVRNLHVDESALTGESVAVDKATAEVGTAASLGDRSGMAYSGTLVTSGTGRGVVVATGERTELGRIGRLLADVQTLETPLLRRLSVFGRRLTAGILGIAGVTLAAGVLLRGYPLVDMVLAAVGIAVAAIPEGLPAVMTVMLATGVRSMARRNAIVRRLPAVEALGSVTVICTDKTGTLTRNEMTVQRLLTAHHDIDVQGTGYAPQGALREGGATLAVDALPAAVREAIRAGLLCNDAVLREVDGRWRIEGDPTEGALLVLAAKAGLDAHAEAVHRPRVDAIPFESDYGFMATLHHDHAGHAAVLVKGAPERVMAMCAAQRDGRDGGTGDMPLDAAHWHDRLETLARGGQRVLALAARSMPDGATELGFDDLRGGLVLLGLVGIVDPPRDEAIRAVAMCRSAGVQVKMITGDHAVTATAIGDRLGIGGERPALTGPEIEAMDDVALREAVAVTDVFARASPEHKLRLVRALQARGEVVAMTGDGVNDAPALKQADIGVAMGLKGTEAAKEAAEMVLADDNFASIAAAVEEGRTVYENLRKSFVYVLPTNGAEAAVLLAAIALGLALPITAVQILWVNMVTEVTLSMSIAAERPEPGAMRRPPRDPAEPLLDGFLVWRIAMVSTLLAAGSIGLFLWALEAGMSLEQARCVAVNTVVAGEIFYLFNCRRLTEPVTGIDGLLGNRWMLAAVGATVLMQAVFTFAPPMQALFGVAPPEPHAWLAILGVGVALFVIVELEKHARAAWHRHAARDGSKPVVQSR